MKISGSVQIRTGACTARGCLACWCDGWASVRAQQPARVRVSYGWRWDDMLVWVGARENVSKCFAQKLHLPSTIYHLLLFQRVNTSNLLISTHF